MKALLLAVPVVLVAQTPIDKSIVDLQGGGVHVSISLPGFKKEADVTKLSDQHTSLGMFSADEKTKENIGGSFIISVIAHDLPKGADLPKMGTAIIIDKLQKSALSPNVDDGSFLQVKRYTTPNGLSLFYIEDHNEAKNSYRQFQFYFEYIDGGTWIELHMSMPTPVNGGPKNGIGPVMDMVDNIIRSIKVTKI